jgi:uncharacterized cupredoxin-like copper-binding protein
MSTLTRIMVAVVSSVFLLSPAAFAGGNLAKQKPIEVRLDMGKDGVGNHEFYPDKLTFETGKLYKLVLHNPSDSKHYFTSPDFVSRIYTRKVQVMDDLGAGAKQIGEIKGAVSEVEVYPGGTTEWWFVPVATGNATVWCHIKDKDGKTHRDKGMDGMITIL